MIDIIQSSEPNSSLTESRKTDHLDLCLNQNVDSEIGAGWDKVRIPHCALPDVNFDEISLKTNFLNFHFNSPILISSMTGGTAEADEMNCKLAVFAELNNIPMGLGSQRFLIEKRNNGESLKSALRVREVAPKAQLWANLGAVQLNYGVSSDDCNWLVDQLQAQAFILHLNPLQEVIQKEGDKNFSGLWTKIEQLKNKIKVPLILKETGCGIDPQTALKAFNSGVDAIDVAGLGGTHWGLIEGLRHSERRAFGELFKNWGIPSAEALVLLREKLPKSYPIIASGGIKNGLDCAKALHLGANLTGLALPFLKALSLGTDQLNLTYDQICESIKIACFAAGVKCPKEISSI
jgi:isopentenyl-diphosphate delta-isomerase